MVLAIDSTLTMAPASIAVKPAICWLIGEACPITISPDILINKYIISRNQYCIVFTISPDLKLWTAIAPFLVSGGIQPEGLYPSGAAFINGAPIAIPIIVIIAWTRNVLLGPIDAIRDVQIGAKIIDPNPKPATAKPEINPFLSGNHFTHVAIGTP